jgi:hypothetical protein
VSETPATATVASSILNSNQRRMAILKLNEPPGQYLYQTGRLDWCRQGRMFSSSQGLKIDLSMWLITVLCHGDKTPHFLN